MAAMLERFKGRSRSSLTADQREKGERAGRWHEPIQGELCPSRASFHGIWSFSVPFINGGTSRKSGENNKSKVNEDANLVEAKKEEEEEVKMGQCKLIQSWNSGSLFIRRLGNRSCSIKSRCSSVIGKKRTSNKGN